MRKANGEIFAVHFSYEKLTVFCNLCGKLGHAEQMCEILFMVDDPSTLEQGWGSWLKTTVQQGGRVDSCRWLRDRKGNPVHQISRNFSNNT